MTSDLLREHERPSGHPVLPTSREQVGHLEGLPRWITLELIYYTIRVWQPYYKQSLSLSDAVDILLNMQVFRRVLSVSAAPHA